ncbi:Uncharacterised protein [Kingella potus]|uniref:VacJ-like protein n=1 Tax=Kingella potus TaxID=265175 RepID=A0A377R4P3_9NEIS|nr:hypothetical protein [Kingella potus]UOO99961.1 hypothetical protein LVJ84_07925 [Kingella potus]STR03239.1 Uncharacterised protein [Kingella potus]
MYFVDRTAVVLKPTQKFLDWLKSTDDSLPELTLAQIRSNCSVFLVPEADTPEAVIGYFGERSRQIFEAEISSWEVEHKDWPQDMGVQAFWEFFEVEIHDAVFDLEQADIKIRSVLDNI